MKIDIDSDVLVDERTYHVRAIARIDKMLAEGRARAEEAEVEEEPEPWQRPAPRVHTGGQSVREAASKLLAGPKPKRPLHRELLIALEQVDQGESGAWTTTEELHRKLDIERWVVGKQMVQMVGNGLAEVTEGDRSRVRITARGRVRAEWFRNHPLHTQYRESI